MANRKGEAFLVIGSQMIEWAKGNGHARLIDDVKTALGEYGEWKKQTAWSRKLVGKSADDLRAMAVLYEERLKALREATR